MSLNTTSVIPTATSITNETNNNTDHINEEKKQETTKSTSSDGNTNIYNINKDIDSYINCRISIWSKSELEMLPYEHIKKYEVLYIIFIYVMYLHTVHIIYILYIYRYFNVFSVILMDLMCLKKRGIYIYI
jgi:hypothetical protein